MREFKSFFKTVGGNEGGKCHYPTRLDTYGCGCQHNCKYCYAKSLLEFRGLWDPNEPAVADIKKIERAIIKYKKSGATGPIRLGGMTDCFMPMEAKIENTYKTILLLNKYEVPYLIVTKSALIADYKYRSILNKDLAHIQITVTTTNDKKSRQYESASLPIARLNAIKILQDEGFDVAIRLSPFIKDYIDVEYLKTFKINKAIVEFLRINHWIKKWFDLDYSDWTLKEGGYQHLPLEKKLEQIKQLEGCFNEISVCEDVTDHYDHWKNNYNPKPNDCCNLRGIYE